jgi:pimeloyl-ACP methyl ester carboxylesterase
VARPNSASPGRFPPSGRPWSNSPPEPVEKPDKVQAARVDPAALAALRIPTQVVYGQLSPAWLIEASQVAAVLIPSAELIPLAGHGHLAAATAPDLLAEIIARLRP